MLTTTHMKDLANSEVARTILNTTHTNGINFPGPSNLHSDIYPAITASLTPSLHQPGKVVLITGAGRGCGRAIAIQYAHARVACLVLCARSTNELDEVEGEIRGFNAEVRIRKFTVDVKSEDAVQACAKEIGREEGRLDVLVNNAGASEPWVLMAESKTSEWWNTMEVNVKGPFLFLHAFLPLLSATSEKQGKHTHVVNVSSIAAVMLVPTASAYNTSKFALVRMTEFVDAEYGPKEGKGVICMALHPGAVPSRLANAVDVLRESQMLVDTPELSGGFTVWLTQGEKTWLSGRYVSANWDVEKLESMKDEIVEGDKLKIRLVV